MFGSRRNTQARGVVVCGVDGSRVAREALQTADELSRRLEMALVVAHVVEPLPVRGRPWEPPDAETSAEDVAAGEARLQQECSAAGLEYVERQVLVGRPAERLAELADDLDAALVVVGSRGHRLVQAALVGSVSSELLGLAPCPVLVLPARAVEWHEGDGALAPVTSAGR
jgi:nucleotide-binding universal stress UspA family protein